MFSYLWFISAYLELVVRKSTDSSSPLRLCHLHGIENEQKKSSSIFKHFECTFVDGVACSSRAREISKRFGTKPKRKSLSPIYYLSIRRFKSFPLSTRLSSTGINLIPLPIYIFSLIEPRRNKKDCNESKQKKIRFLFHYFGFVDKLFHA